MDGGRVQTDYISLWLNAGHRLLIWILPTSALPVQALLDLPSRWSLIAAEHALLFSIRENLFPAASTAAAGMLAADDPENPPELYPFVPSEPGDLSPLLDRLFNLSGIAIPFPDDDHSAGGSLLSRRPRILLFWVRRHFHFCFPA